MSRKTETVTDMFETKTVFVFETGESVEVYTPQFGNGEEFPEWIAGKILNRDDDGNYAVIDENGRRRSVGVEALREPKG